MKTLEKIMLYPIGLWYLIADRTRKASKFIGRKTKPAIAMLVALALLVSLMPTTVLAVEDYSAWSDGETVSAGTYDLNGATVTITGTLAIDGAVTIENGTIKRGPGFDGEMFAVGDGDSLTLQDLTVDGNREIQTGDSIIVIHSGTVTLGSGAVLTNNEITSIRGVGSAVTVTEGTLNIDGGRITDNVAYSDGGSTIKTYYGSTVNMTAGEISGNSGAKHGGAIQLYGATETNAYTEKQTVFNMSGGAIVGNSCSGVGGGVAVSRKALFNMTGGSITGNSCGASGKGGGVAFSESASNNIEMSISGDAIISGNKKGSADNNLEIGTENKLTVGTMGSNASVGVTMASAGVFSNGGAEYANKTYFVSDKSDYVVAADNTDLALIVHDFVASVTIGGATTYYENIYEAIDAVKDCTDDDYAVVKMQQDIDLGSACLEPSSGVFILDLNGKTLSSSKNTWGTVSPSGGTITIIDSGEGGTITHSSYSGVQIWGGTLTINGGTIIGDHTGVEIVKGTAIINGGTIYAPGTNGVGVVANMECTVTINGGTITGTEYDLWNWESTIILGMGENGVGATFPGGLVMQDDDGYGRPKPDGLTLKDILGVGTAYWQGDKMLTDVTGTSIEGDVTVKAVCDHANSTYPADGITDTQHKLVCACGYAVTGDHTTEKDENKVNCQHGNICDLCGKIYSEKNNHVFGENYRCTLCGEACPHESYTGGYCTDCGKAATYNVEWGYAENLTGLVETFTYGQDFRVELTIPTNTHLRIRDVCVYDDFSAKVKYT